MNKIFRQQVFIGHVALTDNPLPPEQEKALLHVLAILLASLLINGSAEPTASTLFSTVLALLAAISAAF